MWKGSISMKHVISLIETQGRIQTLSLPGLEASSSIRLRDFFQPSQVFSRIHELNIALSHDQTCDGEIYEIVKKSPNLRELHIRFSRDTADAASQAVRVRINASMNRKRLHSTVTRLTLHGTTFSSPNAIEFPALRALAVIDCDFEGLFFINLDPKAFPQLIALMVKTHGTVDSVTLRVFMRGLKGLRELIVEGVGSWFSDCSEITKHGRTLQLLSLWNLQDTCSFSAVENEAEDALGALPALRHLSLFVADVFSNYSGMHLGFNCRTYGSILTPWAREDQNFAHVDQGALSEESLGRDTITRVRDGLDIYKPTDSLEYLSVTATCRLYPGRLKHDSTFHRKDSTSFKKHMFSLKPKVTFGETSEMKKQMLDEYSGDGYYFLEEYIDGTMEKSQVYLTNRS
ncbi:hypothetical protein HBH64_179100 [Parastagonospora nodorum]|nr:hypothetical protein HBH52_176040 [Parastagonospora nodorum]KAH3993722.1 hypothetical protein HBI10_196500 [Parastagonospora nodorum]KAH4095444.1 hypothetical protein HBH46_167740 [Parastagonospora nodorum]KAH4218518.1 hypothetical protein HBI06_201240 [Parastagonospora nodorum]KAH4231219.1 hypothetical protein HBI05_181660 [Parastagonospora nodorum]